MDVDKKMKAKELHQQGFSLRKIANELGVSKSSVGNWIQNNFPAENEIELETVSEYPPPVETETIIVDNKSNIYFFSVVFAILCGILIWLYLANKK